MLVTKRYGRWLLLMLLIGCIGCTSSSEPLPDSQPVEEEGLYGFYSFGGEQIPIESYTTYADTHFLLKISPLEEILSATTYAIIGVHRELLGQELDVAYRFHNDDYIFVYEDPVCYFSPYRPLREGNIYLQCNEAGYVKANVAVVLYDGTPFNFACEGLLHQPNEEEIVVR